MRFGDHYTSHEFQNLHWTAFKNLIEHEDPSPECCTHSLNFDSSIFDIPDETEIVIENNSDNDKRVVHSSHFWAILTHFDLILKFIFFRMRQELNQKWSFLKN